MSRELSEKFESIREAIQANLNTIRTLLEQADDLTKLIDETPDDDLKLRLQQSLFGLYDTTGQLIKDSNILFDRYLDLARSVAD